MKKKTQVKTVKTQTEIPKVIMGWFPKSRVITLVGWGRVLDALIQQGEVSLHDHEYVGEMSPTAEGLYLTLETKK